jgi:uncharacterized lipoprotein YddW (UPF0748 family)
MKRFCSVVFLLFFAFSPGLLAADVPLELTIDECRYQDSAGAQALWMPMRGSLPAGVQELDGRSVLRLNCNFAGTATERVSWDRSVKLDLSSGRGIRFEILCRNPSPVSYFSLYFRSGSGWYHAAFYPESAVGWNTIVIDKKDMVAEGKPAGWEQIEAIRLSAWRGAEQDTEFCLRNLRQTGVLGADAHIAILRADSVLQAGSDQAKAVEQSVSTVAQFLYDLDIGCSLISDRELSLEVIKRAQVVILPYNPSLPERSLEALSAYLETGGKVLAFYVVPPGLHNALGLEGATHTKAARAGQFAAIRPLDGALPGAPAKAGQASWNINAFKPVSGASRPLAEWLDDQGRPSGFPAVLDSSNAMLMTHVLLPDDPANKRRLLLAMVGSLAPGIWREAVAASIDRIGRFSAYAGFDEAQRAIESSKPGDHRVREALAAAASQRHAARRSLAGAEYAEALERSESAGQHLLRAFCLAQPSPPSEFRAFWCHSAFGVQGLDWDQAIRQLAENGFNAVIPNMLWGGAAFYPSKVLPVVPQVAEKGDQIALCLAACKKYGVQMHVWKVNWNLGHAAPREFAEKMRKERRLQADSSGKEEPWLCPSHPENQKLEISSMVELARKYDVAGIHFDYIRYPDADHCFCSGCKQRFQAHLRTATIRWPQDVLNDGDHRKRWLDWRRANITTVVKGVSAQVRPLKPKLKISAAVFSNWSLDRDTIGQDWRLWCDKGYLDFVCPMNYTASNGNFENRILKQLPWAGRVPCYPGIGFSASVGPFGVDRVIDQINISRRMNTGGFVIFNYAVREYNELLPMLGLGVTAQSR